MECPKCGDEVLYLIDGGCKKCGPAPKKPVIKERSQAKKRTHYRVKIDGEFVYRKLRNI